MSDPQLSEQVSSSCKMFPHWTHGWLVWKGCIKSVAELPNRCGCRQKHNEGMLTFIFLFLEIYWGFLCWPELMHLGFCFKENHKLISACRHWRIQDAECHTMLTMCEITCCDKFTGIVHHAKLHLQADSNDQTLTFLKLDSLFQWRFRGRKKKVKGHQTYYHSTLSL